MTGSRFPVFLLRLFLTRPHRPGIKAAEDGLYIVVGLPQAALYRGDTSSSMGRAMMYIASVFSQLERKTIAERIRDNMHELAKTGRSFTPVLHLLSCNNASTSKWIFWSRESGSFFLLQRVSCEGFGLTPLFSKTESSFYTVLLYLLLFYLRCILSLPGGSQIFQQCPAHHRACRLGKRQPQCPATGRLQWAGHHTGAAECLHH